MTETKYWLLNWLATRKEFTRGTPEQRAVVDYFQAGVLDSFGVMEFVVEVEEQFGISFTNQDFQDRRFKTVEGLASIIEERRTRKDAA